MALTKHSRRTVKCPVCGIRGFYWYHNSDKEPAKAGKLNVMNSGPDKDGICHEGSYACKARDLEGKSVAWELYPEWQKVTPHTHTPEEIAAATPQKRTYNRRPTAEGSQVDSAAIAELRTQIESLKAEISSVHVTQIEIKDRKHSTKARKLDHPSHFKFAKVLGALQAGDHVWLTGPAGTGKSTIAKQCAEAMGLPFGSISLTVTTPLSDIVGYRDANGNYQDTAFRRIYEGGGVFLADECDNGNPNTLGKLNEALANGECEFPDKRIVKHPDCFIVAAANTYGTGPDRAYVGRMQIDAATLDRFSSITIPVDEALESSVALAHANTDETKAQIERLISFVRKLRKEADNHRMPLVFSPRACIFGAKLLASGEFSMAEVIEMRVRKGISESDWAKLMLTVPQPR